MTHDHDHVRHANRIAGLASLGWEGRLALAAPALALVWLLIALVTG